MTLDAVGRGALVVTARAEGDVATSRGAVEVARPRVCRPADRVRVLPSYPVPADAPFHVAPVARRGFVTAEASGRIDLRLHRMPHQEVSSVHESSFDRLGAPLLDGEALADVVAPIAIRLCVTGLAELLLLRRGRSVSADEIPFVPEEGPRHQLNEILPLVAWRALSPIPLCLVLVAFQALLHRWDARRIVFDDARVARHALTAEIREREMTVVIERDDPIWPLRGRREHLPHLLLLASVATIAK